MCNDFGNHIPYSDYLAAFSQTRIPVKWPTAVPNLEPREDIWSTDKSPIVRRLEDGTNEFTEFTLGLFTGRAERCAGHQFSIRGPAVSGRPLSGAGFTFLRVHRHEVAEDEMEIHQGW